jgi:rod shape-determining protein MreC
MDRFFGRKFWSWFLAVVLFLVLINLPRVGDIYLFKQTRMVLAAVVYPVQLAGKTFFSFAGSSFGRLATLFSASSQNQQLKTELAALKVKLVAAESLQAENRQLSAALNFLSRSPLKLLPSRIISDGASNLFGTLLINRGSSHGVEKDMAVIAPQGLVGKIDEVFPFSARVLLIVDPQSFVSAYDQASGDFGLVAGKNFYLSFDYVPVSAGLRVGDLLVTSSRSDIFPSGLAVGKISKVTKKDNDIFQVVKVVPTVDFSRLDFVFVVQNRRGGR